MEATSDWQACQAHARMLDVVPDSDIGPPSLVWIRSAKDQKYFAHGKAWLCTPLGLMQARMAENAVCTGCRWFDTKQPGSLEDISTLGHLDLSVRAPECLVGSFLDASNPDAWLRRDNLIQHGRYAAACISPEVLDRSWSTHWACMAVVGPASLCLCFLCRWPLRTLLGQLIGGCVGADDHGGTYRQETPQDASGWHNIPGLGPSRRPMGAGQSRKEAHDIYRDRADLPGAMPLRRDVSEVFQCGRASQVIRDIEEDMLDNIDASEADRKQLMRKYMMRWHPDKNTVDDKEIATAVIQYLNSKKEWFLNPSMHPETSPLLSGSHQ